MWARVAAFEGTDVERARAEVARRPAEDLTPSGLRGVVSLLDADGKRQLFITFFDSREQIEAARCPVVAETANSNSPRAGTSAKPSDGLEPSTPSLPWRF